MSFGVLDGDLSDLVIAGSWRFEFDTGCNESVVHAVDVVDDEPRPRPQAAGVVFPVGYGPIKPDLAVTNDQLHVANDAVLIWPSLALDESQDAHAPVGDCAGVGTEQIRDDSSNLGVGHVGSFRLCMRLQHCEIDNSWIVGIDARRQRVIDIVEVLPEAVSEVGGDEEQHLGFTVRKKRFAWYLDDHHGDGVVAVSCKAPLGVNTELAAAEPERFFIPAYNGKKGWLGVRLDVDAVDWDEVARLIEDAYRLTAPKSLVAQLDDRRS